MLCCQVSHLEPFRKAVFYAETRPGQTAASEFLVISAPTVLYAGFSVALIQQAAAMGSTNALPWTQTLRPDETCNLTHLNAMSFKWHRPRWLCGGGTGAGLVVGNGNASGDRAGAAFGTAQTTLDFLTDSVSISIGEQAHRRRQCFSTATTLINHDDFNGKSLNSPTLR